MLRFALRALVLQSKGVHFPGRDIGHNAPIATPPRAGAAARRAPSREETDAAGTTTASTADAGALRLAPSEEHAQRVATSEEDAATARAIAEVLMANQADEVGGTN